MSRYRTPGNSEFVEALGWAVWNFLYLEETIVRWIWLLEPKSDLSGIRAGTAFTKGVELGRAAKGAGLPDDLYIDLQTWLRQYEVMVDRGRNALTHAHAYTEEHGPDGWKPGLAYTDPDRQQHILARSPEDLHVAAEAIEHLMLALSDLESRLQSHLQDDSRAVTSTASQPLLGE